METREPHIIKLIGATGRAIANRIEQIVPFITQNVQRLAEVQLRTISFLSSSLLLSSSSHLSLLPSPLPLSRTQSQSSFFFSVRTQTILKLPSEQVEHTSKAHATRCQDSCHTAVGVFHNSGLL